MSGMIAAEIENGALARSALGSLDLALPVEQLGNGPADTHGAVVEVDVPAMQADQRIGIGGDLAARARITRRYLEPAMTTPGVAVRLHDTILYNSVYRFDDDVLVNPHALGAPAGQNPVLHFRYTPVRRLSPPQVPSGGRAFLRRRETGRRRG
ncbi:hypothetical protein [Streptomyces sp. NRRL S-146]|uniref:hypothetical protein n=1 Tax=Streptomyces sp. NRRL S-146 TaxID=1463884 RepID=UPI000A867EC4|nr:hypothetical protein [Streptomyces sp. NRRL S-146]